MTPPEEPSRDIASASAVVNNQYGTDTPTNDWTLLTVLDKVNALISAHAVPILSVAVTVDVR